MPTDRARSARADALPLIAVLTSVLLAGLLAMALCLAVAWHNGALDNFRGRLANAIATSASHVRMMLVFHHWMDPQVPSGAVIFLGDSITQGLVTTNVAPTSVNFGIGGLKASELLENLPTYASLERAGAIFLLIGINDLSWGNADQLADDLGRLARALPAQVPLVWSAILPAYSPSVPMSTIVNTNATIRALCRARADCHFIDTHALLSVGDASLFPDGIHPDLEAYRRWTAAMRATWQEIAINAAGSGSTQAPQR